MSARSIRRAQERKAQKLARKAEKSASAQPTGMDEAAFLSEPKTQQMNPELFDEFTPEFIAEANAAHERVWRNAGLLPSPSAPTRFAQPTPNVRDAESEPRPSEPRTSVNGRVSPTQLPSEPKPGASGHFSAAQVAANRANSQLSTGAKSPEGKQTVSFNAFRHGLTGRFAIMPYESEQDYQELLDGLRQEHRPSTPTEHLLVDRMAQHHWLSQRALYLQGVCFNEAGACDHDAHLALYLRYQTTHERAFHKCLSDLLKLRADRRKEQIGFVSQQHKEADQTRRQARENRLQERHHWAVLLASAKLHKQQGRIGSVDIRGNPVLASVQI